MKCKQVQDLDTAQQKTPGQKLVSKQAEKKSEKQERDMFFLFLNKHIL